MTLIPHNLPAGFIIPLHRALVDPVLLAGAPRAFAILNGTIAAVIGLGLRLWLVGVAVSLVGHLISVAVTKRDPAFLDVLSRHIQHKEHLSC